MKCFFCNAEMLEGKDKCDNCGNYQHNAGVNLEEKLKDFNNKKKRNYKKALIDLGIFLLIVAVLAVVLMIVVNTLNNREFYGKWNCSNNQVKIEIDSKNLKIDYGNSSYLETTYKVDSEENEEDYNKYFITATKLTDSSTIKLELVMEKGKTMKLTDTTTTSTYTCSKAEK